MILVRKRETLGKDIYSLPGTNGDEVLKIFKKRLTEKIDLVNKLIDTDYDSLTNEEYYYLIRNIFDIILKEQDFLAYISKMRKKEYSYFCTIPTSMTFSEYKSEGKGINSSFWKQTYQVFVEVAVSDKTNLDSKKKYSKEEIRNMYLANQITVLDYESMELEKFMKDMENFDEYPTPIYKLAKKIIPNNEEYKNEFDFYMNALRRKVNKEFIMGELRKYVEELNVELYDIFISSSMLDEYGKVAKKCKKWFKENNKNDDLNNLSKRLSKRKN